MPFTIDFLDDGRVLEWDATADGAVATEIVTRRPGFRRDEEPVLAVNVDHIDRVTSLTWQARQLNTYPVGDLACFNVDFSREFRYCLEENVDPTPASELSTLRLSVPVTGTGAEPTLSCPSPATLSPDHRRIS